MKLRGSSAVRVPLGVIALLPILNLALGGLTVQPDWFWPGFGLGLVLAAATVARARSVLRKLSSPPRWALVLWLWIIGADLIAGITFLGNTSLDRKREFSGRGLEVFVLDRKVEWGGGPHAGLIYVSDGPILMRELGTVPFAVWEIEVVLGAVRVIGTATAVELEY